MIRVLLCEDGDLSKADLDGFEIIRTDHSPPHLDELLRHAPDCDAIVVRNMTKIDASVVRALRGSRVKIIGRLGTGLDNIDVECAQDNGLEVINAPGVNANATAELALSLTLALTRNVVSADRSMRARRWDRYALFGREMSELVVGVVGLGRIGRRYAELCARMGSRVVGYARRERQVEGVEYCPSLEDVLKTADVVSLHIPSNPETRGFFDRRLLNLMKDDAILVNTARGEIVNEDDLLAHLQENPEFSAGLDVRCGEPPANIGFEKLPNTVLTPHIGAFSLNAQQMVAVKVFDDIAHFFAEGRLRAPA